MIDWPFIIGYVAIGSVALYLQYRSNVQALDKLSAEHERHTADLKMTLEVLQLDLMHAREIRQGEMAALREENMQLKEALEMIKLNRVTHADFAEGAVES